MKIKLICIFVLLVFFFVVGAKRDKSRDEIVRNVSYREATRIKGDLVYKYNLGYEDLKVLILGELPRGAVEANLKALPLSKNESFTDYCITADHGPLWNFRSLVVYQSLRVIVIDNVDDIAFCGNMTINSDGGDTTFGPNCEVIPPQDMSLLSGNISEYEAVEILEDFMHQYEFHGGSVRRLGDMSAEIMAASFAAVPLLENEDFRKYGIYIYGEYQNRTGLPAVYKHARVLYGDADEQPSLCVKEICSNSRYYADYGPRCEKICPIPRYISYEMAQSITADFITEFNSCVEEHELYPLATAPRYLLTSQLDSFPYSNAENLWGYLLVTTWNFRCDYGPDVYKDMRILYTSKEKLYSGEPFCEELTCTGPGTILEPNNVTALYGYYYYCSENVCPPQEVKESRDNHVFAYACMIAASLTILVLLVYRFKGQPKHIAMPNNRTNSTEITSGPQPAVPPHYAPVPQYYPPFPRSLPASAPHYYVPVPQFYPPFPQPQPTST